MSGYSQQGESSDDDSNEDSDDSLKESSSDSDREGAQAHRPRPRSDPRAVSAPAANQPRGVTDPASGHIWDELAQLIRRNLMQAAVANAQHLGINLAELESVSLSHLPHLD